MSLAINVDKVVAVLVAGKWYDVDEGSFDIDAYEFLSGDGQPLLLGGRTKGVVSVGATWRSDTGVAKYCISVPLTAIQAVRERHD
jgi:hypothetical protein